MRWGLDFCCWQLREGELGKFGLVASVSLSRFLPRFFFFGGGLLWSWMNQTLPIPAEKHGPFALWVYVEAHHLRSLEIKIFSLRGHGKIFPGIQATEDEIP